MLVITLNPNHKLLMDDKDMNVISLFFHVISLVWRLLLFWSNLYHRLTN
jgi:hypothetical protein